MSRSTATARSGPRPLLRAFDWKRVLGEFDTAGHAVVQGEYRYFAYPLPELVARLREAAYPPLARLANTWNEHLGVAGEYPPTLAAFTAHCHAHGQTRPTPLLLKYGAGDYNR